MIKNFFLAGVLVLACTFSAHSQVKGNAIGLRFGGGYAGNYGTEITFQHGLSKSNRLEADLGISNWGTNLSGVYQWVWNIEDGFNWYAGIGGNLGIWNGKDNYSGFNLGVAGQVGVEYNFDIPLQLSLDYRPVISLVNSRGYSDGIALSVRYRF